MYMRKSWKWLALCGVFIAFGQRQAVATNPVDGTITVTPVATVDLTLSPTTYAFGAIDVGASTVTVSALTLSNSGSVDVTVDKRIQTQSNPAGWSASTIASPNNAPNTYALFVATAAARPTAGSFDVTSHLFNGTSANALRGLGGGSPVVTTSAGALPSVDLWFRLDMPTSVVDSQAREITVRFTGTAQ
jgi:hypothetical protein